MRAAFPQYTVSVMKSGGGHRFEPIHRSGDGSPWCLISGDVQEMWRELRGLNVRASPGDGAARCRYGRSGRVGSAGTLADHRASTWPRRQ